MEWLICNGVLLLVLALLSQDLEIRMWLMVGLLALNVGMLVIKVVCSLGYRVRSYFKVAAIKI